MPAKPAHEALTETLERRVQHGYQEDADRAGGDHAAEHGGSHGAAADLGGARCDDQRSEAENEGDRRHHDGAEPRLSAQYRGLVDVHAGLALLLGELHDQDAILGGERDQHDQTDLTVKVEAESGHLDCDERSEHANDDGQQDRNRDRPALVQRDQEQVGEQDGQRQDDAGLAGGGLFLIGGAGPFEIVARRQGLVGYGGHRLQSGARRNTLGRSAVDRDGAIVVVAGDDLRSLLEAAVGDGSERHHLVAVVADVDLPQVGNVVAVGRLALDVDLPGPAQHVEIVDVDAAQRGLQRGEDVAYVQPERLRLAAVDVEIDQRIGGRERREDSRQRRIGVGGGDHAAHDAVDGRGFLPFEGFQHVLEPATGRQADDRGKVEGHDFGLANSRSFGKHFADEFVCRVGGSRPLRERLQAYDQEGVVRQIAAVEQRIADDRQRVLYGRQVLQDILDALGHVAGPRDRGAIGQLDHDEEGPLVLLRQEAGRNNPGDAEDGAGKDSDRRQGQDGQPQQRAHDPGIAVARPIDAAQHLRYDPAAWSCVAQEQRAERGRQRQRIDRRDQHRSADRDGELAEQGAGDAGNEGDRHEHREQHQRDGDDGRGDLRHGPFGRFAWRQIRLLLEHALDVLNHHDRIVDDDADRHDHGEQRHRVGGIPQPQQDREGGDQADRNRDHGNDRRTKAAQEQEDHDDDQDERLGQRVQHLVDRVGHESGGVELDEMFQPGRKADGRLLQGPLNAGGGRHRVGARCEIDGDADTRLPVDARLVVEVLCADLDAGDVADMQQRAVRVGAQDDVAEFLWRAEPPLRLQIELELLVVVGRSRADPSDRRLDALYPDHVDDI